MDYWLTNITMSNQNNHVTLRFYASLNNFLSADHQQTDFDQAFNGKASVKDLIESSGVPHTEIALIVVNNESVDFTYHPQHNDHISVYPEFTQLDISALSKTQPEPLTDIRFVVDTHMGKLAKYLRMLGFDTLYRNNYSDSELASISASENRILLTRDRGLLKRSIINYAYFVRTTGSHQQLREVVSRFDLTSLIKPFSRCINCNGELVKVNKKDIADKLQARTKAFYQHFKQCRDCQNIYWQGSHHHKMQKLIAEITDQAFLSTASRACR